MRLRPGLAAGTALTYIRGTMQLSDPEVKRLSPRERLDLIEQLWSSLDDADIQMTSAQREDLDHRLSHIEDETAGGVTWDALKTELRERRE